MENIFLIGYYLLFLLSSLGLGRLVIKLLKLEPSNIVEKATLALAFGTIVLSYIFHILGFLHILYSEFLLILYVICSAAHVQYLVFSDKIFARHTFQIAFQRLKTASPKNLVLLSVIVFIFFPLIPYLFLFPASWDVVAYHLPLIKFYLAQHSFPFAAWFDQTGFPIGIEAVYGLGEAVKEPRVSHLIHFTYILAIPVYMLYGLKNYFSEKTRILASLLFIFQPMIYSETAMSAFVDYPLAFFSLVITMLTVTFFQKPDILKFFGICIVICFLPLLKISGGIISVAVLYLLGVLLFNSRKKITFTFKTVKYWCFGLLAGLPALIWFGRNMYYTNNPFYPFYNSIFKGLGYVSGSQDLMSDDILKNAFIKQMVTNFLTTSDTPQDYSNLSSVGFMFLGILACLLFIRSKKFEIRLISQLTLIVFGILLLLIGPLTRYVFFVFPALSLLIASVVFESNIHTNQKIFTAFKSCFIVLLICVIFVQIDATFFVRQKIYLSQYKRHWLYFMDYKTAKAILYQQNNYPIQEYANTHLNPQTDKVLQLLDNRIYYLDIPGEFANTIAGAYFTDTQTTSSAQVYKKIKNDGFTHVIKYNDWGAHPVMNATVFDGFVNDYLIPEATVSAHTLYKIK